MLFAQAEGSLQLTIVANKGMHRTILTKNARNIALHRKFSTGRTLLDEPLRQQLRELLRHTAQPVAVVTSLMRSKNAPEPPFHGATLSSFASIAMDPYPLISFALRIPSRMASSLKSVQQDEASHMVINLLSAEQASLAVKFSRADLHPKPFLSVPYTLTQEGLPVLEGSLGAISCQLVTAAVPLHKLDYSGNKTSGEDASHSEKMVYSELFIARVVRVEKVETIEGDDEHPRTLPLLYHRRGYTSCQTGKSKS